MGFSKITLSTNSLFLLISILKLNPCSANNFPKNSLGLGYLIKKRGGSSDLPPPPPPHYYHPADEQQQEGNSRRINDGSYPEPDNYYNAQEINKEEEYNLNRRHPYARAYQREPQQQQEGIPPPLPTWDDPNHNQMNNHNYRQEIQRPQLGPPQHQPPPSSPDGKIETSISEIVDKDYIFSGLKRLYRKKILPLELSSKYGHFQSPPMSPSDFEAKPMVLLLGQYSVGKTTFIEYLLGRSFPGQRIGPEPTTDRFTAIMAGPRDKITPGAALCSQADRPFRGLSPFGNNFLSRLEGVEMNAPILHNITLIDTPGILSGQKQGVAGRNYDYESVMKWFAERADLIIVMFDAHKLDISDELKRVMELMIPHSEKVRVVLNKADCVNTQQLMRVCKYFLLLKAFL